MGSEDDERRRQARERLEARMERSRASGSRTPNRAGRAEAARVRPGARNEGPAATGALPGARLPWKIVVAALAAVAAIVLLLAFAIPSCAGDARPSAESSAAESSGASVEAEPDTAALADIIGQEEADKLVAQAQTSDDARWIAANLDAFTFEAPEVQAKVLKLAADDPLALSFVRNFPEQYAPNVEAASKGMMEGDALFAAANPDESLALPTGSPSADVPDTNVPHLYQWDRRWGYIVYNGDAFGLSGCGPTSLAMVYQTLTGSADITPLDVAKLAYEGGYVVEWLGTSNDFFTAGASELGLTCEMIDLSADAIVQTLRSGTPIVANLGVGSFTSYGHFFVLAGVADNGEIIVNDPYSATRSSKTWDPEVIASESLALYAYSL